MPTTTVSITPCWKRLLERSLIGIFLALATLLPLAAAAGSIDVRQAAVIATDEGYALSAEFGVDLGPRLEEAVSRGVPLHFMLEFDLTQPRWYWANEHIAGRTVNYRLAYNALTRHYRLSAGALHQNFDSLPDALRTLGRIVSLPVAEKGALKSGESYSAAVRLSLDRSQLPKPFQVDAIGNKEWQVDAKVFRWQFTPPVAGTPATIPATAAEAAK
jgi:hypothetical protein